MFYFEGYRIALEVEAEIPESEWVVRAQNGDEDAFVRLAQGYRARVWGTAARFARSAAETEDLVQDLFIRIWRGLPSYRGDAPFEHWVMTLTVRGCYDFLRRNRRRREAEFLREPGAREDPADPAEARSAARRDARELVRLLLSRLDPRDRTVITLLDLEERGVRETAALTGWSESNVKVRAHRARRKMRALCEELGIEP